MAINEALNPKIIKRKEYKHFKVGQRVFFSLRHGINAFGNIIEIHPENSSVMILADNFIDKYERLMSIVTVVKK